VSNPEEPRPEVAPDATGATDPAEADCEAIRQILQRARAGDATVVLAVREFLKQRGAADAFGGNLAWTAVSALARAYAGTDILLREAIYQKLNLLHARLAGDTENPTAVEELIIERIISTWLHLHELEIDYAKRDELTIPQGSYFQRAISAAQKRYLAALRELIELRKQPLPAVQINVAREQVNVAGNVVADGG
jgi:hypothetical protein